MKKTFILIAIVVTHLIGHAQKDLNSNISVFFSNNICSTLKYSADYEPLYGYKFGLLYSERLSEKSFIKLGLDFSKYGLQQDYTYNPGGDFHNYNEEMGTPPYQINYIWEEFFFGIPLQIKTTLFKSIYIDYGFALNYTYKSAHHIEYVSSDDIITIEDRSQNYLKDFETSNITLGLDLGLGYYFNINSVLKGNIGVEFTMPSALRSPNYPDLTMPYSIGLKTSIDIFFKKKVK